MVESAVMKVRDWRKLGVAGLSALVLLVLLLLIMGRSHRPETSARLAGPWNSGAIESAFAGVRVREIDESSAAVVFLYDLNNKTDSDYQLTKGPSVVVMSRVKSSGALSPEKQVILSSSAFVPAKSRTRIAVEVTEPFSWPGRAGAASENRFRELVAQEVTDLDGFVLFDETPRYQIELSGAWPEIEKAPLSVRRR